MRLSFQGKVTWINGGFSDLVWRNNLYPGQTFDFTVLIDPSRPGTYVSTNNITRPVSELADPGLPGFYEDALYADFVEGTRLWDPALTGDGPYSANYAGSTVPTNLPPRADLPLGMLVIAGGPNVSNHWVLIVEKAGETLPEVDPRNWQVGQTFSVYNKATLNFAFSEVDAIVTLTSIAPEPDSDGDGVPDSRDLCPNTSVGEIVDSNGCSISQLVPCNAYWRNHGEYVRKIVEVTSRFAQEGVITDEQSGLIVSNAAKSNCGK